MTETFKQLILKEHSYEFHHLSNLPIMQPLRYPNRNLGSGTRGDCRVPEIPDTTLYSNNVLESTVRIDKKWRDFLEDDIFLGESVVT